MGWLNAIGNVLLAVAVGLGLQFAISFMFVVGSTITPVTQMELTYASLTTTSFMYMLLFGLSALVIRLRKRLLFEAPPDPYGFAMSKAARYTCIMFVVMVVGVFVLMSLAFMEYAGAEIGPPTHVPALEIILGTVLIVGIALIYRQNKHRGYTSMGRKDTT